MTISEDGFHRIDYSISCRNLPCACNVDLILSCLGSKFSQALHVPMLDVCGKQAHLLFYKPPEIFGHLERGLRSTRAINTVIHYWGNFMRKGSEPTFMMSEDEENIMEWKHIPGQPGTGPPSDHNELPVDLNKNEKATMDENLQLMLTDPFDGRSIHDPETGSETSGISENTFSESEAACKGGNVHSGRSSVTSVTSDFEEEPLPLESQNEGTLGEVNFRLLAGKIGEEFDKLGTFLKFTCAEMYGFKVECPNNLADRIFHMLVTWKKRTSRPKVEDLASALQQCGRTDLAEEIADQVTGAGIPLPRSDQPLTTFQILQKLQEYNYLGPNNVWYMQFILFKLEKKALMRKVWEYASKRFHLNRTLHLHMMECVKDGNHDVVKFKLVGDANHFGSINEEEFKQMIADNFQEEIRYINTVGVQDGCVELYIRLRSKCVERIVKAATAKSECLLQMGVQEVTILGEHPRLIKLTKKDDENKESQLHESKHAQLFLALKDDNKAQAEKLIAEGADPNRKMGGKPYIQWAIFWDKEDLVDLLLKFGADRNQKDDHGFTADQQGEYLRQCRRTLTFFINPDNYIPKHEHTTKPTNGHTSNLAATAAIPKRLTQRSSQVKRQFLCEPCGRVWKTDTFGDKNPLSRCYKCKMERNALPFKKEFKRSKYVCRKCKEEVFTWEYEGVRKHCRNCRIPMIPARNGARRRSSSLQRFAVMNFRKQKSIEAANNGQY